MLCLLQSGLLLDLLAIYHHNYITTNFAYSCRVNCSFSLSLIYKQQFRMIRMVIALWVRNIKVCTLGLQKYWFSVLLYDLEPDKVREGLNYFDAPLYVRGPKHSTLVVPPFMSGTLSTQLYCGASLYVRGPKGKVFYGQEPPSGESTTTDCGVNYLLLAVIYWSSLIGNSLLQSTTTTSYVQCRKRP